MLAGYELDVKILDFADTVKKVLDKYEDKEIKISEFKSTLDKLSAFKNKPLTLGFLFTHMTFYKKDMITPWTLVEIQEIIKANPTMLDIFNTESKKND